MSVEEIKNMAKSIKQRAEKNKEMLNKLDDKKLVLLYELCDELSYDVEFITKEWERDLYCTALFNAMI